jgi:transcriptional regulator with PAS, ATPase and Fis domain
MNAVLSMSPEGVSISENRRLALIARHVASDPDVPPIADVSKELLRTIADVLDIRSVFPRISEIVKHVLPHDSLQLMFHDLAGRSTLEARSTNDVTAYCGCTGSPEEEFSIVPDLRTTRRQLGRDDPSLDNLIAAGYRSLLNVRSVAIDQSMTLGFFSRQADAYSVAHVTRAQHIADHVAVAVAHERLAAAERRRAEAHLRAERLDARVKSLAQEINGRSGSHRAIGHSREWREVLKKATQVAETETTVLLQGESGTGKEVLARFIHGASPRKGRPFGAINCAALPEHLIESELFGYERGAFTGAQQAKPGHIELASGGVLFLDEVSEMSASAQAKVLRVLQEREFQRLGGTRLLRANVRVIAATNLDLRKAVEQGSFRRDLYYRLQVFEIRVPPLRDRPEDVLPLTDAFLQDISRSFGRPIEGLTKGAKDALLAYDWPGNIRELRNALERAAILCEGGLITVEHLSLHSEPMTAASSVGESDLDALQRRTIARVMREVRGNKSKAAKRLGLTRNQLYFRLRKYDLEEPTPVYDDGVSLKRVV